MPTAYTAEQIRQIRAAIAAGRRAVAESQRYEPVVFARAFVDQGGVHLPGAPEDEAARRDVEQKLLQSLAKGRRPPEVAVAREFDRMHRETEWARLAQSNAVVGFLIRLGPAAADNPLCQAIVNQDRGLGAGVFRRSDVVVMPPGCEDYHIEPVTDHLVEE